MFSRRRTCAPGGAEPTASSPAGSTGRTLATATTIGAVGAGPGAAAGAGVDAAALAAGVGVDAAALAAGVGVAAAALVRPGPASGAARPPGGDGRRRRRLRRRRAKCGAGLAAAGEGVAAGAAPATAAARSRNFDDDDVGNLRRAVANLGRQAQRMASGTERGRQDDELPRVVGGGVADLLAVVAEFDLRAGRRAPGDDRVAARLDPHDVEGGRRRRDGARRRRLGLAALGSAVGAAAGELGAGAGAVGAEATEAGGAPRG